MEYGQHQTKLSCGQHRLLGSYLYNQIITFKITEPGEKYDKTNKDINKTRQKYSAKGI